MSKLYCIGELLIDFQSVGVGSIKDTTQFVKKAGGAPANVCVQAVKLGCDGVYLTKVGNDGFGDFLIETLNREGVDTKYILKDAEHDTSLAFVSFTEGVSSAFSERRRQTSTSPRATSKTWSFRRETCSNTEASLSKLSSRERPTNI